jgi:hypothetical protein
MIPLVQRELHQIARRCMDGERGAHSLQPTALVNEAYLRLVEVQQMNWQNRAHFSRDGGSVDAAHPRGPRSSTGTVEIVIVDGVKEFFSLDTNPASLVCTACVAKKQFPDDDDKKTR